MKFTFRILLFTVLTSFMPYSKSCSAQTVDTCILETEKYYWILHENLDTIVFEEAIYDSILCTYKVVAIDTNPRNLTEDSKKYNLIHVTDRTERFMFSIVTFCEDSIDCSSPLQIGAWYNLRLKSVGDNDILWRTDYLDRTFEFFTNGKKVFIGSRTPKFRVVVSDSIKDLFYVGS